MNSHYREFAWQPGDSVAVDRNYYAAWARQFDRVISLGVRYRMGG